MSRARANVGYDQLTLPAGSSINGKQLLYLCEDCRLAFVEPFQLFDHASITAHLKFQKVQDALVVGA